MLKRLNHDVVVAEYAEKGWDLFRKTWENPGEVPFTALICDWVLRQGGMDGPTLIRKIRDSSGQSGKRPYIGAILITAVRKNDRDYQCGIDAGADTFLFKPIKPLEISGLPPSG